jgi:hypothetical protein
MLDIGHYRRVGLHCVIRSLVSERPTVLPALGQGLHDGPIFDHVVDDFISQLFVNILFAQC